MLGKSGNSSDTRRRKISFALSTEEVSETFGLQNSVRTHFELKCMCIDLRMFFSSLRELIFQRMKLWQQWCVGVPGGAFTRQTGCQFPQTRLFWSTLKLGHRFIFQTQWLRCNAMAAPEEQVTFSKSQTCSRPDGLLVPNKWPKCIRNGAVVGLNNIWWTYDETGGASASYVFSQRSWK